MTNASRDEERREARHTDANTEALREMALDTLQQWTCSCWEIINACMVDAINSHCSITAIVVK